MVDKMKVAQNGVKVGILFVIEKYMFSKVKNIKHKIKLAKYGAIAFAIIFILQLITTIYLFFTVLDLQNKL